MPLRARQFRPARRFRRVRNVLGIGAGLLLSGFLYTSLAPEPQAVTVRDVVASRGEALYNNSCISCHGANLEGTPGRAPGLIGVGAAAVHLQVSSGRMPMAREQEQAHRKAPAPEFDPNTADGKRNLQDLATYVQEHGGGPRLPGGTDADLIGADPDKGGAEFRQNCSSCHNFTGRGGAIAAGGFAPPLTPATPQQMYAAMLTGPQAMPTFADSQLTPEEKRNIIAYVLSVRGQRNVPGGFNLGEFGPSTEGAIAFVVTMGAFVTVALWLGARA